jgi:hypothetical protein
MTRSRGVPTVSQTFRVGGAPLYQREHEAEYATVEANSAADSASGLVIKTEIHPTPAHAPRAPAHVGRKPRVIVQVCKHVIGGSPQPDVALRVVGKRFLLGGLTTCHSAPLHKFVRRCPGTAQPQARLSDKSNRTLSSANASTTDPEWAILTSS